MQDRTSLPVGPCPESQRGQMLAPSPPIYIDEKGFFCVDGIKLGRVVGAALEVCDKDADRSLRRGSRFVYVDLQLLGTILFAFVAEGA